MRQPSSSPGFSLTELLVIMCLISILAAFSLPAMTGIKNSGDTRMAAVELSSIFNEARMTAVSQNTYTYVFFKEDNAARSIDVLLYCSTTGINSFESSPTLDTAAVALGRPTRRITLQQVGLLPNSDLPSPSSSPYERTPASTHIGVGYKLTDRGETFAKAIVFRPTGEMGIPQSAGILAYGGIMEFALSWNITAEGEPALSPRPVLIFQVAAATGQTSVHYAH